MQITVSYSILKLNKDKLTKALDAKIQIAIRNALREFLKAAIKKVPILTGMARGGFLPLGRYLNLTTPIYDIPDYKGRTWADRKPKPTRNAAIGESLSEIITDNLSYPKYKVAFANNVVHFNINDPDNWRATAAGRRAAEKYLNKIDLPNILDYMQRITVEREFNG